jgi:hypothetical protein
MRVNFDREANVLNITSGTPVATAASLLDDPGVAVELATAEGHDIVGLIVIGASAYLPLGLGYDSKTDTLLLGKKTDDPDLVTVCGDFVGFWQVDELEPDGFRDPIGVAIRQASVHLAGA